MGKISLHQQYYNGYQNDLIILLSANTWEHHDAVKRIKHRRQAFPKELGKWEDFERKLLFDWRVDPNFFNQKIKEDDAHEAALACESMSQSWLSQHQRVNYVDTIQWIILSYDINRWKKAVDGIQAVIDVCMSTADNDKLFAFGHHVWTQLAKAKLDEKGLWYDLSKTYISDDKVPTIEAWQAGFAVMKSLIAQANEICARNGKKSPFPKIENA